MVKAKIKGVDKEVEMVGTTCYQIPSKKGETIYVARVNAGTGKNGKPIYRFARILDTGACKETKIINRKVSKLVIGKREFPKALRLITGAGTKAPASVPGKMLVAIAVKQSKRQKRTNKEANK
jgi:hypothetical protein